MQMIPAPMRQFKTWSMILLILAGLFDLAVIFVGALTDLQLMSTQTLAIVNASLAFAIGAVRFVHQQIAVTMEQKADMHAGVEAAPIKLTPKPTQLPGDGVLRLLPLVLFLFLAGCAAGINQLSPEQLKQLEGLAACNYYHGMYGKAGTVVVSNDTVRKGATNKFKVSISPDAGCAVTIEGDVGVASPPLVGASAPVK